MFLNCVIDVDVFVTTDVRLSCYYQPTILMCIHIMLLLLLLLFFFVFVLLPRCTKKLLLLTYSIDVNTCFVVAIVVVVVVVVVVLSKNKFLDCIDDNTDVCITSDVQLS